MVGLRPRMTHGRTARQGFPLDPDLTLLSAARLWNKGVPGAARLWLDMRKAGAGRRAGNANKVVASGTLNLPPRVARVALQRLVAVGTIEFEFRGVHTLSSHSMRKAIGKSI
jgi:hypothetical protein